MVDSQRSCRPSFAVPLEHHLTHRAQGKACSPLQPVQMPLEAGDRRQPSEHPSRPRRSPRVRGGRRSPSTSSSVRLAHPGLAADVDVAPAAAAELVAGPRTETSRRSGTGAGRHRPRRSSRTSLPTARGAGSRTGRGRSRRRCGRRSRRGGAGALTRRVVPAMIKRWGGQSVGSGHASFKRTNDRTAARERTADESESRGRCRGL